MEFIHLFLLGLIQGLTEFLPVSSSAHLILLPNIAGWQDQGLAYDVAAHAGSLVAVITYFRKELNKLAKAGAYSCIHRRLTAESRLLLYLLFATLPVAIAGYYFHDVLASWFRNPVIIAISTIIFALLLWWSDIYGKRFCQIDKLNMRDAMFIGFAQMLSLIPGTSRSGITMTAALMLGYDRVTSARFSFLLAIPVIIIAGSYESYRQIAIVSEADINAFLFVFITSMLSAFVAIHLFLEFIQRTGMLPYVIYRILLGVVLLFVFI